MSERRGSPVRRNLLGRGGANDQVPEETLKSLLRAYNEEPSRRLEIAAEIDRQFRRDAALLVLDSSGFSRTTRVHGIIHFLALLERLDRAVRPLVEAAGGHILKEEADNIFALFGTAEAALSCAEAIMAALRMTNEVLPAADEMYVSIGIGFGSVLLVGDSDAFGDEMNVTCKLGEDLAQREEILLTPGAYRALGEPNEGFEEIRFSVSGLEFVAHRRLAAG